VSREFPDKPVCLCRSLQKAFVPENGQKPNYRLRWLLKRTKTHIQTFEFGISATVFRESLPDEYYLFLKGKIRVADLYRL
jgi:hypothetical protein